MGVSRNGFNKLTSVIFVILCLSFVCKTSYAKEDYSNKRVLFISSYNNNFLSVPDQINGISDILNPLSIEFDIEYMDTKRFDSSEYITMFHDLLKYKLNQVEPYDGIIVGDDNALQFVLDYKDELFYGLPIAFLGINDLDRAKEAFEHFSITGVVEETSIKENIELGMKFIEDAKNIVAIVDNTLTGRGNKEQFYSYREQFKELTFTDINVSEYTFDEVSKLVSEIPDDSIIIYFSMYTDITGTDITIPEAIKILKESTSLPIFRSEIGGISDGILGGKMVSYYESGKIAARMLVDVFSGILIESIPMVIESPNFYTFDYQLIKEYNIDVNLIPKDSIILNKEITFYEENKEIVHITFVFLAFLVFILCFLFIDNVKRRKMQKELQESHEELTQTFEELTASEEELRAQYDTITEHSENINLLNQKYTIAIESTNSAVWEFDRATKKIKISKNFIIDINTNIREEENIYDLFDLILSEETKDKLIGEFVKYNAGLIKEINIQVQICDINNNDRWIIVRGKGVRDAYGDYNVIHGILLDITKMKEQEKYIKHLAEHDYLTNLPNRFSFITSLNSEIEKGNKGAVLLLDIDNFKSINDTLGHIYGDKLLIEISNRLTTMPLSKYEVFRFGGDEFLLLLKDYDDIKDVELDVEKIIHLFDEPFVIDYSEQFIKFSIGISCYPTDSNVVEYLLMNVDTAMYNVKKAGRDNYMFYHNDMLDEMIQRAKIENLLRQAIKEDGFILVYQPQVNVNTGEIAGFEALLRLRNHFVSPAEFIDIAEDTGMIKEIGRWVTEHAIKQLDTWRKEGKKQIPIAINFSSKQISDVGYISFLKHCLVKYNVNPKYLELEITESILLEKSDDTICFLESIKDMGLRIALDDFGTGFSSLNYLTYIPVNKIKLDKSLCEKFLGLDDIKVMEGLIRLVHSLKLEITAEGIEDFEQYEKLLVGECDYIQGYLFGKPMDIIEINEIYNCNLLDKLKFKESNIL